MTLLALIISPLVSAVISLFVKRKVLSLEIIAGLASLVEFISGIIVALKVSQNGIYSVGNFFSIDSFGAIVILTIATIGLATTFYSIGYLREEVSKQIIGFRRVKQYFILSHLFLMSMFFAVSSVNPILMWIAIEATTLSTAFLISFYNKPSAMEAAWKYLIINSIGLLLGFLGTLLFFTPTLDLSISGFIDWNALFENASNFNSLIAKIAFIFILIGYGTKVGFVPMHTWKPDAYSKAPTPIIALFSGSLLNVAFFAILKFKAITDIAIGSTFSQNLMIFFGVLSMVVAAFIILIQKNYKRLFAYSSIEHAGIMALGFGLGGIGSFAAILHMIYHALAKSILFFSAGNIFLKYSSTKISAIRGILTSLPITGMMLLIGFLAITAIPPFGIFITEAYILFAAISHNMILTIIILLSFVIIFIGFLRHIAQMVFGEPSQSITKGESNYWTIIPPIALTILLIILGFVLPQQLKSLIDAAVSSINR